MYSFDPMNDTPKRKVEENDVGMGERNLEELVVPTDLKIHFKPFQDGNDNGTNLINQHLNPRAHGDRSVDEIRARFYSEMKKRGHALHPANNEPTAAQVPDQLPKSRFLNPIEKMKHVFEALPDFTFIFRSKFGGKDGQVKEVRLPSFFTMLYSHSSETFEPHRSSRTMIIENIFDPPEILKKIPLKDHINIFDDQNGGLPSPDFMFDFHSILFGRKSPTVKDPSFFPGYIFARHLRLHQICELFHQSLLHDMDSVDHTLIGALLSKCIVYCEPLRYKSLRTGALFFWNFGNKELSKRNRSFMNKLQNNNANSLKKKISDQFTTIPEDLKIYFRWRYLQHTRNRQPGALKYEKIMSYPPFQQDDSTLASRLGVFLWCEDSFSKRVLFSIVRRFKTFRNPRGKEYKLLKEREIDMNYLRSILQLFHCLDEVEALAGKDFENSHFVVDKMILECINIQKLVVESARREKMIQFRKKLQNMIQTSESLYSQTIELQERRTGHTGRKIRPKLGGKTIRSSELFRQMIEKIYSDVQFSKKVGNLDIISRNRVTGSTVLLGDLNRAVLCLKSPIFYARMKEMKEKEEEKEKKKEPKKNEMNQKMVLEMKDFTYSQLVVILKEIYYGHVLNSWVEEVVKLEIVEEKVPDSAKRTMDRLKLFSYQICDEEEFFRKVVVFLVSLIHKCQKYDEKRLINKLKNILREYQIDLMEEHFKSKYVRKIEDVVHTGDLNVILEKEEMKEWYDNVLLKQSPKWYVNYSLARTSRFRRILDAIYRKSRNDVIQEQILNGSESVAVVPIDSEHEETKTKSKTETKVEKEEPKKPKKSKIQKNVETPEEEILENTTAPSFQKKEDIWNYPSTPTFRHVSTPKTNPWVSGLTPTNGNFAYIAPSPLRTNPTPISDELSDQEIKALMEDPGCKYLQQDVFSDNFDRKRSALAELREYLASKFS